jgi:hypothetical protein
LKIILWLRHHTVSNMVTTPTIARAARNWMLWEDAVRLAEADQRTGRNSTAFAEAELAIQHETEAAEAGQGHAA